MTSVSYNRNILESFIVTVYSISAIYFLKPYFVWGDDLFIFFIILIFIGFVFCFYYWSLSLGKEIIPFLCASVIAAYFSISSGYNVLGFATHVLLIGAYFLIRPRLSTRIYEAFRFFFLVSLLPGMMLWFLYAIGIDSSFAFKGVMPAEDIPNQLKVENGVGYYVYYGSVVLDYYIDSGAQLFRFSAVYDEPGWVGSIAALLLVAERLNLKRFGNVLLLLAGLMSFSLAFILVLIVYALYQRRLRLLALFIFALSLVMNSAGTEYSSQMKQLIIDRLTIEDGSLVGYNRSTDILEVYLYDWITTDSLLVLLFGSSKLGWDSDLGSEGTKLVLQHGLVGVLGMLCILSLLVRGRWRNANVLVLICVFFGVWFQRPYDALFLPYIVIVAGGIDSIPNNKYSFDRLSSIRLKKSFR